MHALFTRSVQAERYGDRTNAGISDLESAIYLAFTDVFITADRQQYNALRDINTFNPRGAAILWYRDIAHGFLSLGTIAKV